MSDPNEPRASARTAPRTPAIELPLKPAVFVDRDKTLIEDPGYIQHPDQVHLLDGVAQALTRLRQAGYCVIVVTNQSGVARGLLTEDDLAAVHQRMQDLLQAQGSGVDAIYYCPYLDGPGAVRQAYRRDSSLRKPKPGMLHLASREMGIDLSRSWMVGDGESDVEAGRAAGCRTVLLGVDPGSAPPSADFAVPDLAAAADLILTQTDPPAETRNKADHTRVCHAPTQTGPPSPAAVGCDDKTLDAILEELRTIRREKQYDDFSIGKLAAAIAQAFAICAVGWGLYAATNGDNTAATIRLLVGIAFQLMALTCLAASRK